MSEKFPAPKFDAVEQPKNERQEKNEFPKLKLIICTLKSDDVVARALELVLKTLITPEQCQMIYGSDNLVENVVRNKPDVVLLMDYGVGFDEMSRSVTAIRNQPRIITQPVLMAFGFSERELKPLVDVGVDMSFELPFLLPALLGKLSSVPEMVGSLEDAYGDKMLKSKQGFYKEYKDKLAARSEVTADTEKEVGLLESIFRKHQVKNVLDAGGGEGRIALPLLDKGYDVSNLDSSHELLEKAKQKNHQLKAVESDIRQLAVKDGQYDAVTYNWHVLCEILGVKGKKQVLAEAFRALRDGGVVVFDLPDRTEHAEFKKDGVYISYPDPEARWGRKPVYVGYVPSEEEMKKMLEESGFSQIEVKKWKTKAGFPKVTFIGKKLKKPDSK